MRRENLVCRILFRKPNQEELTLALWFEGTRETSVAFAAWLLHCPCCTSTRRHLRCLGCHFHCSPVPICCTVLRMLHRTNNVDSVKSRTGEPLGGVTTMRNNKKTRTVTQTFQCAFIRTVDGVSDIQLNQTTR